MMTSVKFDEKTQRKIDKLMKKAAKFEDDIRKGRKGKKDNVNIGEKIDSVDEMNAEIRRLLVSDPTLYLDKFYKDKYDGKVSCFHIRGVTKGSDGESDMFIITEVIAKNDMCDWFEGEKEITFKLVPVDYLNISDYATKEISAKKFKKVFNKVNRKLGYAVTTDYEDTL